MNKPWKWKPKDAITAARLNSLSCNLSCLLKRANTPTPTGNGGAASVSNNDHAPQESIPPARYEHDTALYWRHAHLGTADIVGNEQAGYYATPPAITRADGKELYTGSGCACIIPACVLQPPPCDADKTLFINISTTCTGEIVGTPSYSWCAQDTSLYGLQRGGGLL